MFKNYSCLLVSFGALLGSCRQEDANRLADDATTPTGPGARAPARLWLQISCTRRLRLPAEAQAQAGRAFDYVVYDETAGGTTKTAPHLDPSTVTGDVTAMSSSLDGSLSVCHNRPDYDGASHDLPRWLCCAGFASTSNLDEVWCICHG